MTPTRFFILATCLVLAGCGKEKTEEELRADFAEADRAFQSAAGDTQAIMSALARRAAGQSAPVAQSAPAGSLPLAGSPAPAAPR